MLNYFLDNQSSEINYGIKKYARFDYFRERFKYDIDKVVNYYRSRDRAVNNRHILSRLINAIVPNIKLDDIDYLKIVEVTAKFTSKQFGITSNINFGVTHENIFYGSNSSELLIYIEKDIDLNYISENYKNISCVVPIYTEDTDLDYYVPMGTKDLRKSSLSVFEIDIVTMLLQYKAWCRDRLIENSSINPNVFVATIVIPNMLYRLTDLALWNRFLAIHRTEYIPRFVIKHPFVLMNLETNIDKIYTDINKYVSNNSIPLDTVLETIPAVSEDSMWNVLKIDLNYYTSQSEWVLWVSRIYTIRDILSVLGEKGLARNTSLTNQLPVKIRMLENRSTQLETKLDEDQYIKYLYAIDDIKKIVGKR
jgi:hypothetical protein